MGESVRDAEKDTELTREERKEKSRSGEVGSGRGRDRGVREGEVAIGRSLLQWRLPPR